IPRRKLLTFFEHATVQPVLTAHPTEVQRKSILDRHHAITDLLQDRDLGCAGGGGQLERKLRREVVILWKTSELRAAKPTVADEIENGLAYFRSTFFEVIPTLYGELEDGIGDGIHIAPFLRIGSWVGGDRDGNPYVTHSVLRRAVERQGALALEHYLTMIHSLGSELSLSSRYMEVSAELADLAARSPDRGASRAQEPFRRALTGVYARLAATAERLVRDDAEPRAAVGPADPYATPAELLSDLDIIDGSLRSHG